MSTSDNFDYKDIQSSNDKDVDCVNGVKIYLNNLRKQDNYDDILNAIREEFYQQKNQQLNANQLRSVLESNGVILSDENFKPMFNKMDITKVGSVDFLQFLEYLVYESDVRNKRYEDEDEETSLTSNSSHDAEVVKTIYCSLYHVLISVSAADSVISMWNPENGKLITRRTLAHFKVVLCKKLPVEIAAANLDPSGGLLVTGAVDGTIHIWDPNNGTCLNKLQLLSKEKITEIIWLPNRILATGVDRQVTEFNDPFTMSKGKLWQPIHKDTVSCACAKGPSLFVTATQTGELRFWQLERGQLIAKDKLRFKPNDDAGDSRRPTLPNRADSATPLGRNEVTESGSADGKPNTEAGDDVSGKLDKRYMVTAVCVLVNRPEAQDVGTLFIATRNGVVQLWYTHLGAKCVAQFSAIHGGDDYVTAMVSDTKNDFLFTSFESGYVKTWYVVNFGVDGSNRVVRKVPMVPLRLRFPFLLESFFVGPAERATAKNPSEVLLVNSYRAHIGSVRHIEYIDKLEQVVTSGVDKNIRVWSFVGDYVGTLGLPWPSAFKTDSVNNVSSLIPPDIKREASFTTTKIFEHKNNTLKLTHTSEELEQLLDLEKQRRMCIKKTQTNLQIPQCPKHPLHDFYNEQLEREKAFITDQLEKNIVESKKIMENLNYVPLSELSTIPKLTFTNETQQKKKIVIIK